MITDELREWAREQRTGNVLTCYPPKYEIHGVEEDVLAIADRIDAEHQKATAGCIHYDPERHYCSVHGDTENGWVRLPVDADGVPIHVGDEMCNTHKDGFMAKRVTGLCLHSGGRWTAQVDEVRLRWHDADKLRHYTPPTVEDVLEEFFGKANLPDGTQTRAELIAEYAAKLRLAGDGE